MSPSLLEALRGIGVEDLLPAELEQRLGALTLNPSGSADAGDLLRRRGAVAAPNPAALPGLAGMAVEAPDLVAPAGLPAELVAERDGAAVARWAIDVRLDQLRLLVPGLRPAREQAGAGGAVGLEADPAAAEVRIVGKAVLRIAASGGAAPRVGLIDAFAAADPFGAHGAVVDLAFEPASFFVGPSSFGLTVETVAYDDSESASPAPKPAAWHGLAIRRATLFLPPGAPLLGDVSLTVEDVFLGDPAGVDGRAELMLASGDPAHGNRPYSTKVEVEWHDPGARGLAEAVPSRAEATVSWPGGQLPLPGGGSAAVSSPGAAAGPAPTWVLRGSWGHDGISGADELTLTLDVRGSPAGIAEIPSRPLAGALGLAPALIGEAGDPAADPADGEAAKVGALIGVLGAAAEVLLQDGSRTIVNSLTLDHVEPAASAGGKTRLRVDYTVELAFEVAAPGLPLGVSTLPERPMKLRYRGVGVEIDAGAGKWYDGVRLVMAGVVPEVVDPGAWRLGPPLDDLLRVTGVRSGAQSQWLEVGLAMAADLGVVRFSDATVRVVFGAGGIEAVELRGLAAEVEVPGVISGEGALDLSGGALRAGLDVEIVPLKLAARADLALEHDAALAFTMVAVTVGVRFPAAIPFANSGLGLFGLLGRFVSNGERTVDRGNPDQVGRELDWLEKPSNQKYHGHKGQYAMGLGAVVGTVPDAGFTFNAVGMVTVEFPRPAVILAVSAKVLSGPAPEPTDQAPKPSSGASITGLIVIDEDAVTVALRGHYGIEDLIEVDVPFGAWFPFADPANSWVHLGADGQLPERAGPPVTVTLLPTLLKQRVWAFVMVHGNGLHPGLLGKPEFQFDGFAIGFGAGWEINWSAGPIKLEASAMVLAGFGTDPLLLAAGIWVRGSLDLVVVRIAARGEITLLTNGKAVDLHGKFCGEVDLFFFSLSGCVEINIAASLGGPKPAPSPLAGVDLVSRAGTATARAVAAGAGEPPAVWPDTVPVVHFSHFVEPDIAGGSFKIGQPLPGPVWSGSRDLKYAYKITEVRLERADGQPFGPPPGKQFDSVWWWPGVRRDGVPPPLSATGIETRDLALLSWQPWGGSLPLTDPKHSPADPGGLIGSVCDPVERAQPLCLLGALGRQTGPGKAVLNEAPEAAAAQRRAPARLLLVTGTEALSWEDLLALAPYAGFVVSPGRVVRLSQAVSTPGGAELERGWRLAGLMRSGQEIGSLVTRGTYDPPLEQATLVLEVCLVEFREVGIAAVDLPEGMVDDEHRGLLIGGLHRVDQVTPPVVKGILADGSEKEWPAEVVREGRCIEVHYAAPSLGPWFGVEIGTSPGRRVTVAASCGIHWEHALERRQAEAQKEDLDASFAAHAVAVGTTLAEFGLPGKLPVEHAGPKRTLLPANTEMRLVVSWAWQAWPGKEGKSKPPGLPDEGAWKDGEPEEYSFRTAKLAAAVKPPPPLDRIGEASFDPRGVARYVTAAVPSGELPHLLDDPIRFVFSIDYLPALLDAYGFEALVEVRPTDVAPGSLAGQRPPSVLETVKLTPWIGDGALAPIELLAVEAIAASPCLPESGLGGTAAEVTAALEPDTPYDLILVAAKAADDKDRRTIERSHFRTSRYRDVGELLEALGLSPGAPVGPGPPDLLLPGPWPALATIEFDDEAFAKALEDLDLDPWPLSPEPRTTVLWARAGDPAQPEWLLAGVMLEAPEPIARKGRVAVSGNVGAKPLRQVRATSSGTRVLLAPSAPVPQQDADVLTVRLDDSLRSWTPEGTVPLHGGPRTIREELG